MAMIPLMGCDHSQCKKSSLVAQILHDYLADKRDLSYRKRKELFHRKCYAYNEFKASSSGAAREKRAVLNSMDEAFTWRKMALSAVRRDLRIKFTPEQCARINSLLLEINDYEDPQYSVTPRRVNLDIFIDTAYRH